eukprot:1424555-Pyramimonas_sp.AAC.1
MPWPKRSFFWRARNTSAQLSRTVTPRRRSASASEHLRAPEKDLAAIATSRTAARLPTLMRAVW